MYDGTMKRVIAAVSLVLSASVLAGCPSKDKASSSGATSPSGSTAAGTGPLAGLESAPFMNEVWTSAEGGQQIPFIFYARENVRVSAQCRLATGQLSCDALRQLRNGMPVEIPRRELTGNVSAGTKVCKKLGHQLLTVHNTAGAEDGVCRFPDGSMVTTGALEQYGMRALE